ncbi:hypothetical protein BKA64DRAFT_686457 [Cadophora sp. MPI-SDFR-AT-0126]|nr:hypothetical protein BKA64DRAFT_686457 [Leotiomycetes sp. MPI-SDFR-AT-0126]
MRSLCGFWAVWVTCIELQAVLALASLDIGIGFELTLDYGTAAAAYSNGTTISVAKIEGGPAYKSEMRRLLLEALTPDSEPSVFVTIIMAFMACLRFLNVIERPGEDSPLKRMLSALKMSSEVFFEEEVQSVEIALPVTRSYSTKRDPQTQELDTILSSIGLSRTNEHPTRSSIATCFSNNITSLTTTSTASSITSLPFILHLSYSCSALLLTLENLELGLLEVTKTTARLDLGAESIRTFPHYWRAVENEMKRFVKGVTVMDVIVSGDKVWEEMEVLNIVKRVLGKKVLQGRNLGRGGGGVDPVWAGAFGVARMTTGQGFEDD